MNGHALAIVACDRGVQRAEEDFARGECTADPFHSSETMQRAGSEGRMRVLVCQRDHGSDLCCQERRQHRSQSLRSFQGLSYCAQCRDEVDVLMKAKLQTLSVLAATAHACP